MWEGWSRRPWRVWDCQVVGAACWGLGGWGGAGARGEVGTSGGSNRRVIQTLSRLMEGDELRWQALGQAEARFWEITSTGVVL